MSFPAIPERLRGFFDQHTPGFWSWWQQAKRYFDVIEYPVNHVCITITSDNPSAALGYGTWESAHSIVAAADTLYFWKRTA